MTEAQFRSLLNRPRLPGDRFLQLLTLRGRLLRRRLQLAILRAIAAL